MSLFDKLNLALRRCDYPQLRTADNYRLIGSGAWHDAYWVKPDDTSALVIRLRKKIIYGEEESWNAQALHEDYASVGLYYQQANACYTGVCPDIYHYRIEPDLIFTLESYIDGKSLALAELSVPSAQSIGHSLGEFFRVMHTQPAPLSGHGELSWQVDNLRARFEPSWAELWQSRYKRAYQQMSELSRQNQFDFDYQLLQKQLDNILNHCHHADEPIVLVNQDITPENILAIDNTWRGLVDPVALLDHGIYYAAWFLHCYRLFLPAISAAPRYRHNNFKQHSDILAHIADGFEQGYAQEDAQLRQALKHNEFLWTLELAHESWCLLRDGCNEKMRLRRGDDANIAATLNRSLQTLQMFNAQQLNGIKPLG